MELVKRGNIAPLTQLVRKKKLPAVALTELMFEHEPPKTSIRYNPGSSSTAVITTPPVASSNARRKCERCCGRKDSKPRSSRPS